MGDALADLLTAACDFGDQTVQVGDAQAVARQGGDDAAQNFTIGRKHRCGHAHKAWVEFALRHGVALFFDSRQGCAHAVPVGAQVRLLGLVGVGVVEFFEFLCQIGR